MITGTYVRLDNKLHEYDPDNPTDVNSSNTNNIKSYTLPKEFGGEEVFQTETLDYMSIFLIIGGEG